MDET
jgi:hypothetical protein